MKPLIILFSLISLVICQEERQPLPIAAIEMPTENDTPEVAAAVAEAVGAASPPDALKAVEPLEEAEGDIPDLDARFGYAYKLNNPHRGGGAGIHRKPAHRRPQHHPDRYDGGHYDRHEPPHDHRRRCHHGNCEHDHPRHYGGGYDHYEHDYHHGGHGGHNHGHGHNDYYYGGHHGGGGGGHHHGGHNHYDWD